MFKLLCSGILALSFNTAMAEDSLVHSEPMHQASEGTFEFTPGIGASPALLLSGLTPGYAMLDLHARNSPLEVKAKVFPIDLSAEYGFTSMFSLGAAVEYSTSNISQSGCTGTASCASPTAKGIDSPLVYFKGRFNAGYGVLQYGVNARVSLEKHKTSSNGNTNVDSGSTKFVPFVGYQVPVSQAVAGVQLSYVAYKTDAKSHDDSVSPSTDTSSNGDTDLVMDLFYEMPFEGYSLGAVVAWDHSPMSHSKTNGVTTSSNDDFNQYDFQVYAPIHFAKLTLIPNVFYQFSDYSSTTSAESHGNAYGIGASLRFML